MSRSLTRNLVLPVSLSLAILPGCAATTPLPGARTPGLQTPSGRGVSAGSQDLLYLGGGDQTSYVLTYPNAKRYGTISNGALGVCSDAAGNVFLTVSNVVQEYAHGATSPSAVLDVPGDFAIDCSVDPASGDLAVAVLCFSCHTSLAIYRRAHGKPKTYDADLAAQHCGYDTAGDVFVSGDGSGPTFYELPRGGKELRPITFDPSLSVGGHIQWDGSSLTVEQSGGYGSSPQISRVKIAGSTGTVTGTTDLQGALEVGNAWIEGDRVVAPFWTSDYGSVKVGYWKYPQGGEPVRVLKLGRYHFHAAHAATISVAAHS